ncbi:helix-turn-helix domain-containing protein [Paenibacillus sp. JMULE4]|uniref:helix-turn-helix transcriptional regulator n=1 Tax=Paenibacillus sp. JMULE4 TaxID=2518342 RepID=UPI002814E44B|nr:helix-turn-helix domain-containing protein [Paenibacillus sp. JMULE4]
MKNNLKDIRFEHRMNQIEFAEFLGLPQQQYNRYENQRTQPSLELALKISGKVNRPVNDLFYLTSPET